MRLRFLALAVLTAAATSACPSDPVVPVDATPDADMTDALDTTQPDTEITVKPAALTNMAPARFEFTATEQATFKCRLDGGAEEACTSPKVINGLTDGPHTFEVKAVDTSHLEDPTPATHAWRIDTVAPETELTETPPDPDNSTTASISFRAPGDLLATFDCSLDGAAFATCTSPFTAMNLSDGNHTFRARARDQAGNVDSTPASLNWEVDTLSPDTVIDTGPAGIVSSTSATFTFSSPGAVDPTFACHLDTAPFAPCTSPRTFNGLTDGQHTFEVRVTDNLGNTDPSPARRVWTVDSTGPVTSITVRPNNPSNDRTPTFEFTANEQSTFECQIDGQVVYQPCVTPWTSPEVLPGTRFFRIRATDVIGNRGPEATFEWLIDSSGPIVTITSGPNGAVATSTAIFNWNSSEPATFCYRFAGDAQDTCTMGLAASGTVTRPGLAEGAQTFTITGTDALGNAGLPTVRNFTVDTIGPAVSITAGPMNTVGTLSNPFTFASPENATFCFKVDGGAEQCTPPPAGLTASVTVNTQDGMHNLEVVARDVLGNRTAMAATRGWTVDTARPTTAIMSGPDQNSVVDSGDATVQLTASEPSTICWKIGAGAETCSAAGQMAFQADITGLTDGVIAFSARSSDAVGAGPPITRTWIVDTVRPDVMITAGPANNAIVGSTEATFIVTSSERSEICWSFNAAAEVCSPPGVTTFSPSKAGLPQGANTFSVRAKDAIGPGMAVERMWTVDTVRPTVTITAGPANNSTQGNNVAMFTATSDQAATICWRFDGAETCSAAGVMSADATSAALGEGSHLFEVYGKDTIGNGAIVSRSWKVDTARPTITIVSGPAQNSVQGSQNATFQVSSSEPAKICWKFNNLAQVCTAPGQVGATFTGTNLPEGATTLAVTGEDAVGVGLATNRAWTVDVTRPSITIANGPANNAVIDGTGGTWQITTAEPATICYRLDGGNPTCSAAGVMMYDIVLMALSQGSHQLAIYATDAVGTGPIVTRNFTIDNIRPVVAITAGIGEGAVIGVQSTTFTVASSESSDICWKFDAAAETCTGAGQLTTTATGNGLGAGAHTFTVRAKDAVGFGVAVVRNFTVDLARPTVTIGMSGPAQGETTSNVFATFEVSASESPVSFCWRFNSGPLTCSAPVQNFPFTINSTPLPTGANVFAVYARDAVGPGTAVLRSWTVDSARPTVMITSGPTQNELIDRNDPTFQVTSSELSTICWFFNMDAPTCTGPGQLGTTAVGSGLPDGPNKFTVSAADNVGAGPAVVRDFVVDTTAPVVTISDPPLDGARTNQVNTNFTITSDEPATICWKLDGGAQTCSAAGELMFSANLVNLTEGSHTLDVTATDAVNRTTNASRVWTVDLTPPVVTIGAPTQNSFSNDVNPTFTITSNEPATICWTLDAMGPPTCSAAGAVNFNASPMNLPPGPHTLLATAQDEATVTGNLTRNWTVVRALQAASSWNAESNGADGNFGFAVASAGDVNADGFADVLVGAPNYSNGQANEGRVYLFLGGAGGLAASPAWTFESDIANARLGWSVASAGDVTGDGKADVLIGAPFYANGQALEGRIYVFAGTASGDLGAAPLFTYESDSAGAQLGVAVSPAGDTNGDGFSDLVAGAPTYAAGQSNEGAVYLFRGTGATVAFTALYDSNVAEAQLGYSLSAGNIMGDAKTDVVAGAPFTNNGAANEGAVYVFAGAAAGLAMPVVYESNVADVRLGEAVSATGDINGDGNADVAASAAGYANGQAGEGGAYVYLGAAGGLTTPPTILERNVAGARFGISVSIAGDVDGDGKADLLVGADQFDPLKADNSSLSNGGAAFLYLGGAGGIATTSIWQAVGDQADDEFGFTVAGAGDVNNDGRKDAVVGAYWYDNGQSNEGRAYQYLALAPGLKPGAPDVLDPAAPIATGAQGRKASAWVRDPGFARGEIAVMDGARMHCSLRGYLSVVGLECVVDGVALAPAYGALGSLTKSDRAWHQVEVAFRDGVAELWIDGRLSDTTGKAARSLVTSADLWAVRGTGGYSVDGLRVGAL